MRRFFAEHLNTESDSVTLTGDEARHICVVLRMRTGDRVLLISGSGVECEACITHCTEDNVELKIIDRRLNFAETPVDITLFQCLPKQGKMEVIIQKCVELGIHSIIPVISKRCVVKTDGKDNKLIRWNKVSAEAAKQCGRAFVPTVGLPVKLADISFNAYDSVLFAYENECENTLKKALRALDGKTKSIAVIIGPEGGFEPEEARSIIENGGVAVSLGKRILRTETAGMAMLAQIVYELE